MVEISLKTKPASHGLWETGVGSDGRHYAVRNTSPLFCLCGESEEAVEKKAASSIESYFRFFKTQ